MSRILARESCFKLLFEYQFLKERNDLSLSSILMTEDLTEDEKQLVQNEYNGLIEKDGELENIISKHLNDYTLNRIFKVDLTILKLAVYELLFADEKTPNKVIINEAVELAKKFSTDKSYKFVNGVLASIVNEEKNGETTN